MLKANSAITAAAGLMVSNYKETITKLKDAAELTLNAHVDNFMTELRATYPQFEFDFWGDHIKVYDSPNPDSTVLDALQQDDDFDLVMTVDRFTSLDSDQREVGMTAAMVAFLDELGKLEYELDSVDFDLTHNYSPRYLG